MHRCTEHLQFVVSIKIKENHVFSASIGLGLKKE